jgi:hypothetical protein
MIHHTAMVFLQYFHIHLICHNTATSPIWSPHRKWKAQHLHCYGLNTTDTVCQAALLRPAQCSESSLLPNFPCATQPAADSQRPSESRAYLGSLLFCCRTSGRLSSGPCKEAILRQYQRFSTPEPTQLRRAQWVHDKLIVWAKLTLLGQGSAVLFFLKKAPPDIMTQTPALSPNCF